MVYLFFFFFFGTRAALDPEWPDDGPPDDMVSSGRGGRNSNRIPAEWRLALQVLLSGTLLAMRPC
jgi:hypothetical protein